MFPLLIVVKLLVAIGVVVTLSIIAERVSPKFAGLVAGLPGGSVITLFFIGLDNGPIFASNAAVYNLIGLIAMQSLLLFYYLASARLKKHVLLLSAICSVAGYLVVISVLQLVPANLFLAVLLPLVSIPVFIYLFKGIKNRRITERVRLSVPVLFGRALAAGLIIFAIIEAAAVVGPKWAGLLTAFPTTVFPLILIVHHTYSKEHVHTIIKHFPIGLVSLIAYSLTVSAVYPLLGIYLGTVVAFAIALAIFAVVYFVNEKRGANQPKE